MSVAKSYESISDPLFHTISPLVLFRSCDNFLSMCQERADIELRYAKSLRKWTEKWTGIVDKGNGYKTYINGYTLVHLFVNNKLNRSTLQTV